MGLERVGRVLKSGLRGLVFGTIGAGGASWIIGEEFTGEDALYTLGIVSVTNMLGRALYETVDFLQGRDRQGRIDARRARRDAEMNRRTRYATYRDSNN